MGLGYNSNRSWNYIAIDHLYHVRKEKSVLTPEEEKEVTEQEAADRKTHTIRSQRDSTRPAHPVYDTQAFRTRNISFQKRSGVPKRQRSTTH
jgi:hypothetical protein